MSDRMTFQSGIHDFNKKNITNYALFLGGLNVTRDALQQYDPLRTGYGRIFMIRKPLFLTQLIPDKLTMFKHVLEYASKGIKGNDDISVDWATMEGGYANRKMEIPSTATDGANDLTITTYEFSGSLMREVIQYWINGVSDFQSGYAHYYGALDADGKLMEISQANHTAEFIYVATDPSGTKVEYACLWANCFPADCKFSHFDYESGQHDTVQMDISFHGTRYMSPQINAQAAKLINKYNVLMNSLNFNGGFNVDSNEEKIKGSVYNAADGKLHAKTEVLETDVVNVAAGNTLEKMSANPLMNEIFG